jgi:pimeloyl-ACP methyl ester carboxylesterase/class 3 adenylate cyclase
MKRCPTCQRTYTDETLSFCREDGAPLVVDPASFYEPPTKLINPTLQQDNELGTKILQSHQPGETQTARITADARPKTKYARSGDINIAYQVIGDGPVDLVYVPGWVSHLEYGWEEPLLARFYRRLASISRLILFDKRGTGLSDQMTDIPTLEQRMDDVRAVMEAAGSERAIVFGMSEGGNMALLFAATYPERTLALVTFGVFAKRVWSPDYPWAPTPKERQKFYDAIEHDWGEPLGIEDLAPSMAHDEQFREWWATYQRRSASPRAALALARMNTSIDVRHVLPAIRVPTLVMHRTGDMDSKVEEGRYVASRIPGAKYVEQPGRDHLLFVGDQDAVLNEVEEFIRDVEHVQDTDTVLATVLFTEIAAQEGQQRRELLEHLRTLARREAEWFKGQVSNIEEGFLAIFDGPVRAIRSACAIDNAARKLNIEIRTGLHTGLCEVTGTKISGVAVKTCAQVAAQASTGEILASNTVKDLISGSGIEFSDKGNHTFEGTSDEWRLFAVQPDSCLVTKS